MAKYLFWVQGPYNESILHNNLSKIKSIGINFHLVVCTNQIIENQIEEVEYIFIDDPGPDCNDFITLNYSRQFSTTNEILNYSDLNSYHFILKLRSDINILDKNKITRLLKLVSTGQKIVVSSYSTMHKENAFKYSYHVSDWIYFGSANLIQEFIAKKSRKENVVNIDKNKIYLEHWVGHETCEQAMIDPTFFRKNNFYKVVTPINLLKYGMELKKYNYLFKPKTIQQFKTVMFARMSNYTQNDYILIKYFPLLQYIIPFLKNTILNRFIVK